MNHLPRLVTIAGAAVLLAAPQMTRGEEVAESQVESQLGLSRESFTGSFQLGVRGVDVEGRDEKYREDFNLQDGPRLFNLNFEFVPSRELRPALDRVEFGLGNLGGDPFETLRLSVEKYGRYHLEYDRRKSSYFYEDIILPPALGSAALANAGDFHTFDFDRVRDTASLEVRLNKAAKLDLGFDRFTKRGHSSTTMDIERDEFEFDKPIDESMNEYHAGVEYVWKKATLVLEERVRDYENLVEIFLPGKSLGEDPEDETVLDFFFLDQPYDFTSLQHTLRLVLQPSRKVILRASGSLQNTDLDVAAAERSQGIDYEGTNFTTDLDGEGRIDRDLELFDLDLTYLINDRVALLAGARRHALDQQGDLLLGAGINASTWDMETTSTDLGLQVSVSPTLTLSGGARLETRDVDFSWLEPEEADRRVEKTENAGYFANLGWRPSRSFRLTGEFESSSVDDPFTLASPTRRQRYRVRGQYGAGEGFSVSGSVLHHDFDNVNSGWEAHYDQFVLRLGYRSGALAASVGYSLVELHRDVDQVVETANGSQMPFAIFYEAETDVLDGHLLWSFHPRWKLGTSLKMYDNQGSFAVRRDNVHVWLEVLLGRAYIAHFGYRVIEFDESRADFDDYEADIVEISLGYRW